MEMCDREGLHQVDLLSPAHAKITREEYWAKTHGQDQMDKTNEKIRAAGLKPASTVFQTQKQFLRDAIDDCSQLSGSFDELILSILVYTLFSRMFDLMQPPAVKHSIAVV